MSKYYLKLDANGYIFGKAFSDGPPDGYVETDLDIYTISADQMYRVVNGEIIATGIPNMPPNNYDIWDEVNGGWIDSRDLDQKKADKWVEIKAARDAQEFGSFDWGGYTFQCDEVSQRRIQGAVQLASMSSAFSIDWTLLDNSVITLTADQMIEVGQTLASHVNALHVKSRGLRIDIESATTEQEISAITW